MSRVYRGEHRSAPAQPDLANLNYYGGAGGNVLVYHPTLGLTPSKSSGQVESFRDDQEGGGGDGGDGGGGDEGGGDSVSVQLPPPGQLFLISYSLILNLKKTYVKFSKR